MSEPGWLLPVRLAMLEVTKRTSSSRVLNAVDCGGTGCEAVTLAGGQPVRRPCRDATSHCRRGGVIDEDARRRDQGDVQRPHRGGNSSNVRNALLRPASAVSNLLIAVRATVM